jgi:hypothetical protein
MAVGTLLLIENTKGKHVQTTALQQRIYALNNKLKPMHKKNIMYLKSLVCTSINTCVILESCVSFKKTAL